MDAPWALWAEIVTPEDEAQDASEIVLIGMYSTEALAVAARGRTEPFLGADERTEWTIEQVVLDEAVWTSGFFDWTEE